MRAHPWPLYKAPPTRVGRTYQGVAWRRPLALVHWVRAYARTHKPPGGARPQPQYAQGSVAAQRWR